MTTSYPIGNTAIPLSKKIVIGQRQDDKKSNIVADTRSILSMILLYYFIKSIMDVSKTARKGGKGLVDDQKSYQIK